MLPGLLIGAANDVVILKKNAANTAYQQVILADPGADKLIGFNNTTNTVEYFSASGTGTVTSASVVAANGVSASVATATTTPAFTFTLGAITPSSVASTGAVSGTTGTFTSTTSLLLGTAGSAVGNIGFRNATSGTATLAPPTGALGTYSVTLPNAASTLPIFGQQITFSGPTAARTITLPDASITVARTDAANTFTGIQSMTSPTIATSIDTASTSFTAFAGATTLFTVGGTGASASSFFPSTLDTTSSTTGAIRTSGGISAAKAANIGTTLTVGTSVTIGSGASTAGALVLGQGTTQSTGTTNITIQAPAAVTSYIRTLPGAVGSTGYVKETVSGSVQTESVVTSIPATDISSGALNIGNNAATVGTLELANGTANTLSASGGVLSVEGVVIPSISSTNTLTNKWVQARVTPITSSATPTYNTDSCDVVNITALAAAITSMTSSRTGTPVDFQQVEFRIKDDGTARAITWGADFSSGMATLPTTTILGKTLHVYCEFDSVTGDFMCMATGSYP